MSGKQATVACVMDECIKRFDRGRRGFFVHLKGVVGPKGEKSDSS